MPHKTKSTRPPLRKLSLLLTLKRFNDNGVYPYATQLIRKDDGRERVPRETESQRRLLLHTMRDHGYIMHKPVQGSPWNHFAITEHGLAYLKSFGGEL